MILFNGGYYFGEYPLGLFLFAAGICLLFPSFVGKLAFRPPVSAGFFLFLLLAGGAGMGGILFLPSFVWSMGATSADGADIVRHGFFLIHNVCLLPISLAIAATLDPEVKRIGAKIVPAWTLSGRRTSLIVSTVGGVAAVWTLSLMALLGIGALNSQGVFSVTGDFGPEHAAQWVDGVFVVAALVCIFPRSAN